MRWRSEWWLWLGFLLAGFFVYRGSLGNGFVGDDMAFVATNTSIRDIGNIVSFFTSPTTLATIEPEWGLDIYRPLRTTSYALDYAIHGLAPAGYHVTSVLLHVLVSITVYLVGRRVVRLARGAAMLGAALFLVHPLHSEAVGWIASRADLIGALFVNLTLLTYAHYRDSRSRPFLVASLLCSLLAYLGKETMVPLPGLLILYDYLRRGVTRWGTWLRSCAPVWIGFAAVCALYLGWRLHVTGRLDVQQDWWGGGLWSHFLMALEVVARYLGLTVLPVEHRLHWVIEPSHSLFDARVMIAVAVIAVSMVLLVVAHRRNRRLFFLLLWFWLALVPIANLVPISFAMMAERYIYMASIGPTLAIGWGLYQVGMALRNRHALRWLPWGATIGILAYSVHAVDVRLPVFRSQATFYEAAVREAPNSAPSHKGLADQYLENRRYEDAWRHFQRAVDLDRYYAEAWSGLATVHRERGEPQAALPLIERALALDGQSPLIRLRAGMVQLDLGRHDRARQHWQHVLQLRPGHPGALYRLGNLDFLEGRRDAAIASYQQALRSDPENVETHYNLAAAYEAVGDREAMRRHLQRFVELAGAEHAAAVERARQKLAR